MESKEDRELVTREGREVGEDKEVATDSREANELAGVQQHVLLLFLSVLYEGNCNFKRALLIKYSYLIG